jgi:hypothetical protein
MRRCFKILALLGAMGAAPAGLAQVDVAGYWRTLTLMDVEAAHRMLAEDHPGAAKEVGDEKFQRSLASAYAKAKERAAKVTSYDGYVATMAGLSVGLGDKHIWSRPLYSLDRPEWPGIILVRQGTDFVVADESGAAEGPPLMGAKLVSCDGIAADRLADQRLAEFKVVRDIEAQLIQKAGSLLLDDGNPFLKRPQNCEFVQDGRTRSVPLKWRGIWSHQYQARLAKMPTRGAAGFGVRKVGEGYWIALQSLSESAVPVVEAVRAQAPAIKAAPYVVLDLRGNGGGNSRFGRSIAEALLGTSYVKAAISGEAPGRENCSKAWRISDRNLKQVETYVTDLGPRQGKEATEAFKKEYETLLAVKAAGRQFSGTPRCAVGPAKASVAKPAVKPDYPGRIILLTDNVCFSSCLMVTDDFRKLGALHVGETTDANTNYMEVREDKLPSGLSMFSTLQALDARAPSQLGPYVPARIFQGNIADTAALEKWIAGMVSS